MAMLSTLGLSQRYVSPTSSSEFLGRREIQNPALKLRRQIFRASSGSRITAWFKFGNRGLDAQGAGIYGSQKRDDFNKDDVEQYFNYMGMLATEGTYDKMDALLGKGIHPVDILLLLAATEGDKPKIEELLRAGAKYDVDDGQGNTALKRAKNEDIRSFILNFKP